MIYALLVTASLSASDLAASPMLREAVLTVSLLLNLKLLHNPSPSQILALLQPPELPSKKLPKLRVPVHVLLLLLLSFIGSCRRIVAKISIATFHRLQMSSCHALHLPTNFASRLRPLKSHVATPSTALSCWTCRAPWTAPQLEQRLIRRKRAM